ncbi:MAG: hypothetical protein INF65_08750 [Roseomonas sp.]|nr:hypothetical protein [Roseomonas sp.]MCA3390668.1 hypothetical protein [Roseomonas sp.]MCA3408035.1 hypothetical protein [Roseomonas sp.]
MSFAFNPPNIFAALRGRARATGGGAATRPQDGLSISPESTMARRVDLLTGCILLLLGLSFMVVSSVFIFTLGIIALG